MKILICGANGFLGSHISKTLRAAGHEVCHGVRRLNFNAALDAPAEIEIDFARDRNVEIWAKRVQRLSQVDVIINAVGILNETSTRRFDHIHRDAPIALFQAAAQCGINTVIQISALGSENDTGDLSSLTPYMRSKREADAMLMQCGLHYLILRPSLVVGIDGVSSQLFRNLASMPVIALPGKGEQQLQPVHVEDICSAIRQWLADPARQAQVVCAVGPTAMSYRRMLEVYRELMDLPPAAMLPVPMPLMRAISQVASLLPNSSLTPNSLRMLEQGNIADVRPFETILQTPAKPATEWFGDVPERMLAQTAISNWSLPLFRYVLALVWFVTAALSFGIYPVSGSLQLLQPLGLTGMPAMLCLMGASTLDLGLGIATLLWPKRLLWLLQAALIVGYSVVIAIFSPEYYLHPFGPILKNLPIVAILVFLYAQPRDTK